MVAFQLIVRSVAGVSFASVAYAKGEVVTGASTDALTQNALGLVGHDCDVFRLSSPGGQVPLEVARKELQELLLPADSSLGVLASERFGAPATADVDAFVGTPLESVNGAQVFADVAFDGVIGQAAFSPARNVTCTVAGGTAAEGGTALIVTGLYRGQPQTETIVLVAAAATYAGVKPFDKVTGLQVTGGTGTGATYEVGFGVLLGFKGNPKVRSGGFNIINEQIDGAKVITGAFSATNNTYTPASAPNGARTWDLTYEIEPPVAA